MSLKKHENVLLIQFRIDKIDLNVFLYEIKILNVLSPNYDYLRRENIIVEHVLLNCPKWSIEKRTHIPSSYDRHQENSDLQKENEDNCQNDLVYEDPGSVQKSRRSRDRTTSVRVKQKSEREREQNGERGQNEGERIKAKERKKKGLYE